MTTPDRRTPRQPARRGSPRVGRPGRGRHPPGGRGGPAAKRPAPPLQRARAADPARAGRLGGAAPPSASATPTPTSCSPGLLRERRLDPRDAALRHRAGLRHPARARASSTPCCRPASTGRWTRSTRPCWTCCASAPTSCCACAPRRTPRSAPPSTWPGGSAPPGPAAFVNAVLRKVAAQDLDAWLEQLAPERRPASATSRCARATRAGCVRPSATRCAATWTRPRAALTADDARPQVHLVARSLPPRRAGGGQRRRAGPWSPCAVRLDRGRRPRRSRPSATAAPGCRTRAASWSRSRSPERRSRVPTRLWVDLCAGPGGKAALLQALADERGARLVACEVQPHRARLVQRGRGAGGARRRRPRAAARRRQRRPRAARRALHRPRRAPPPSRGALAAQPVRPAGAHPAAGRAARRRRPAAAAGRGAGVRDLQPAPGRDGGAGAGRAAAPARLEQLDARPLLPGVPDLGDGPAVQLWPHRHGTDAMHLALLRRDLTAALPGRPVRADEHLASTSGCDLPATGPHALRACDGGGSPPSPAD